MLPPHTNFMFHQLEMILPIDDCEAPLSKPHLRGGGVVMPQNPLALTTFFAW